jgi:GTP diphosphokinase / guanosine-3',5'-bis(diphosphate) 3'-diphosphatase
VVNRTTHAPPKLDISVGGASGIAIRRSLCCLPLPEEDVVGYISRGRGLAIHRRTCPNAIGYAQSEPQRLVDLNWDAQPDQFFDAPLVLVTLSRVGMLNEVTNIFSQTHTNISHAKATERQDKMGVIEITAAVTGAVRLEELMRRLEEMKDIMSVQRGPVHHAPTPPRRVAPRAARSRK